jgi:ABC-type molybdate transport system substrate-binding protein
MKIYTTNLDCVSNLYTIKIQIITLLKQGALKCEFCYVVTLKKRKEKKRKEKKRKEKKRKEKREMEVIYYPVYMNFMIVEQ